MFLKYTVIPVVRYAFTHIMSFLEMELTERKPKYMTVYLNRNYFTHIIDGSCSLHIIGIPCKNLPCKMETWLLTVSSIGKWSVILKILNLRSRTQKIITFFIFTFTTILTKIRALFMHSHRRSIIASHYCSCLSELFMDFQTHFAVFWRL